MNDRLTRIVDSFLEGFAHASGFVLAVFLAVVFLQWMGVGK